MASSPDDVNKRLPTMRDATRTRARILEAARQTFAAHGYAHAGLRDIAALAGINVALVARYFGSKEKLFAAALEASLDTEALRSRSRADFGREVAAMLIDGTGGGSALLILAQAAPVPVAQNVALDFLRGRILEPLAVWIGGAGNREKAAAILALCAGFVTYRTLLPLEEFAGPMRPAARGWFEQALQDIIDGRGMSL
ncbi:MAG: TetR family transcriptional regulator [Sphingobium sp.]